MPFFYGEQVVRTVMIDDEPWFVLADLCKVLELSNPTMVADRLDSDDLSSTEVIDSMGRTQRARMVNETGMYETVFMSRKPEAVSFRRWITGTVLPEIRRTGSYLSPTAIPPRLGEDLLDELEQSNNRTGQAIEVARAERARANKAEARLEVEQRHRHAIEGGDGIDPTTFGKKYFGDVPARQFDKHLYEHDYLIDQRKTRRSSNGEMKDGYDHRKPTANGRKYFYPHDGGTHGGRRRFNPRVRPQMEIALRDALIAEGLPANTHSTGLVLISNKEMQELGA